MNWITIRTTEYTKQAEECWHKWFARYPVTTKEYPDGAKDRIWLETVLRKGTYEPCIEVTWVLYWTYIYKRIE